MSEETAASTASEEAPEESGPRPESRGRTLVIALGLCLVCSVAVSGVAIALHDRQVANQENDRKKVILQVAGLYEEGASIEKLFAQVQSKVVELKTGQYVEDPAFDQRKAAKDPAQSVAIASEHDVAKIRRRAKQASVYLVEKDGQTGLIILPVHGYGLWSTMYGFVALEPDANTISRVQFYEHAETAGLGSRITDPGWVGQFAGKRVYDEKGKTRVRVIKGQVPAGSAGAPYEIDGISGATLTADGVTNLLQYWFGAHGFEPYLAKLKKSGA